MKDNSTRYQNFNEFWPFYLRQHSNPRTRVLHYLGTTLTLLLLLLALVTRNLGLLIFVPLAGYAFAWIGHFFIEHNKPATFQYPLWSLIADYKMYFLFMSGKLEPELKKALRFNQKN
jgi:hypothetical protein